MPPFYALELNPAEDAPNQADPALSNIKKPGINISYARPSKFLPTSHPRKGD
jgi:hypothetical protein